MAVILVAEVAELVQKDVVLEHARQPHDAEVQIDVSLGRAASPVGCVMLDGHTAVCETITRCQFCKTSRKFCLGLEAQRFDLLRRGRMDILISLLLPCHGLEDPPAAGLEEKAGSRIWQHIWNRHRDSLDRMHTDADVPAASAFAEHHLPYLGICNNLFS